MLALSLSSADCESLASSVKNPAGMLYSPPASCESRLKGLPVMASAISAMSLSSAVLVDSGMATVTGTDSASGSWGDSGVRLGMSSLTLTTISASGVNASGSSGIAGDSSNGSSSNGVISSAISISSNSFSASGTSNSSDSCNSAVGISCSC